MKKWIDVFWILILFSITTGCGRTASNSTVSDYDSRSSSIAGTEIPDSYMLENKDNYFDYQSGLECSAFSSAYVLRHFGEPANGMELYQDFPEKMSDGGVMPQGIVTLFESKGYTAEFRPDGTLDELKAELNKGAPVIVFIHIKEPYTNTHNTHYVPMVGYDKEYIYLAESISTLANCKAETDVPYNRKIEWGKFEKLWTNIDGMWDYPYYVITLDEE